MPILDDIEWFVHSELEGIGDDDGIGFHMLEEPVLDLRHLLGQEIDVDIIVTMDIGQEKILLQ